MKPTMHAPTNSNHSNSNHFSSNSASCPEQDMVNETYEAAKTQLNSVAQSAASQARDASEHYLQEPAGDLMSMLSSYARRKPDVAAVWCFGLGLLVGWRLRS